MELIEIGYLCARCHSEHVEAVVDMTHYKPRSKYGLKK